MPKIVRKKNTLRRKYMRRKSVRRNTMLRNTMRGKTMRRKTYKKNTYKRRNYKRRNYKRRNTIRNKKKSKRVIRGGEIKYEENYHSPGDTIQREGAYSKDITFQTYFTLSRGDKKLIKEKEEEISQIKGDIESQLQLYNNSMTLMHNTQKRLAESENWGTRNDVYVSDDQKENLKELDTRIQVLRRRLRRCAEELEIITRKAYGIQEMTFHGAYFVKAIPPKNNNEKIFIYNLYWTIAELFTFPVPNPKQTIIKDLVESKISDDDTDLNVGRMSIEGTFEELSSAILDSMPGKKTGIGETLLFKLYEYMVLNGLPNRELTGRDLIDFIRGSPPPIGPHS